MAGLVRNTGKQLRFYFIKIPFVYLMVAIGFIFEFLITFPLDILVLIDAHRRKNR